MNRARSLSAALIALLVAGCISTPVPADQPARIVEPDDASRAELERAVSEALRVDEVMLADDALTGTSVLVVERSKLRSVEGSPPLSGRDLGTPERFRLLTDGERCVLVHDGSGRRFELAATRCATE